MCYYKLFHLLIPHKHCYYKLFHLLLPHKHVLLQGCFTCWFHTNIAIPSCFICWFHTNIGITSCFICWFHTNVCHYRLFLFKFDCLLRHAVIYFVPDLTAQPASIPHQQGHCNADNWSGASGFFAYFWLITSWCTSNWPNISSDRTALLHCCAECQKTLLSAKLHCLSRLMQNTISVSLCFEHKDPFFYQF